MEGNQHVQNLSGGQFRRATKSPIVRLLAFAMAFCTVFSMIPPAAIMAAPEQILDCPLSIHRHEAACYDAENTLICGMADFVVHTHDDNCYDADSSLVCMLEEIRAHEHSAECFTTEQNLICELAEDETHTHGDGCYESVQTLTCAEEEIILHSHSDSCRDENGNLICGMLEVVEHVHGEGCFAEAAAEDPTVETTTVETTAATTDATTPSEEPSTATTEATVPQETTTETTEATESTEATEAPVAAIAEDATVVASGTCGTSVNWVLTDDGVLTISGSGSMDDCSEFDFAWGFYRDQIRSVTIEHGVTSIGNCAFAMCPLTSITLPNSIISIGDSAFSSCSLTNVTIPDSVTSIGKGVFSSCYSLVEIEVDANNQNYCSIDGVLYSKDKTTLYYYPVSKIDSQGVTIPDFVASIGDFAFSGYGNLTSIVLPDSLISIGDSAFSGCSSLTSIALPDSLTSIGDSAFSGCSSLTSIALPDSLTSIGDFAFHICRGITSITIPEGVTSIGAAAFGYCDSLVEIEVDANNQTYCSIDGVLYSKDKTTLHCYPNGKIDPLEVIIPGFVTSIGNSAFYGCGSLTSITIPEGITSIGDSAFHQCDSLTSITIPDGVTSIGSSTFRDCSSLTSITIPDSVTSIGDSAFFCCSSLASITLPDSLTSIGDSAFHKSGLKSIVIPEGVTSIGASAFYNSPGITSVTLPANLTSIGDSAFSSCRGITSITLGNSPAVVGTDAFSRCSRLKSVAFEKNTSIITSELLNDLGADSGGITEITFQGPNCFTYTGNDYICGKLILSAGDYHADENGVLYRINSDGTAALVYYPDDLALEQYEILPTISSEDGSSTYTVTAIGDSALKNCSRLKKIILPQGITTIGDYALQKCSGLENVNLPQSITAIGHHAFRNCSSLTQITIPANVSSLGNFAFYNCTNLASVNGETALPAVIQAWAAAGADNTTFQNTALSGEVVAVTTADIEIEDDTGRKITISTKATEALTGEAVQTILTIDKGSEDSTSVVRVYFQFVSEFGSMNYPVGSHTFEGISAEVCETTIPNTYYIEIEPLLAGQTLSLTLSSVYENVVSGGGPALIWVEALSAEDAASLGNGVTVPKTAHRVTWTTQTDTFPVTQEKESYSVTLKGDGTPENEPTLRSLSYTIKVNRSNNTSSYGKDPLVSIDFVGTLSLPEHFYWRDGLVEAIRANNWSASTSGDRIDFRVTVNQTTYSLASFNSNASMFDFRGTKLTIDDAGNIQLHWTCTNPDIGTEMPAFSMSMYWGSDVILADSKELALAMEEAGTPITCSFKNNVTAIQHFAYSSDQYREATATNSISVGAADYSIRMDTSSYTPSMGDDVTFYIALSNSSPLPYTALDYVTDPMPVYYYISPADMQTMFYDDTYGKDLSITIGRATLCTPVSNTVTGTDGQSYVITQQYQGVNTPYDEKALAGSDESILATNATLTIRWSEDKANLVLTVGNESYSIGEGCTYSSIQAALDGIGYVVTSSAAYTCRWD